ncbi:hypothetical protein IGI39_004954, partial [Enterococcus sp. AZ135]
ILKHCYISVFTDLELTQNLVHPRIWGYQVENQAKNTE